MIEKIEPATLKLPGAISDGIFYKKSIFETCKATYPEIALFYYLKRVFKDTVERGHQDDDALHIFIPSIHLLVNLGDRDESVKENEKIECIHIEQFAGESTVMHLFQHLIETGKYKGIVPDIALTRDVDPIFESYCMNYRYDIGGPSGAAREDFIRSLRPAAREESLEVLCPEMARIMADVINGDICADMISPWSSLKVWWHCPVCGGYYPASPFDRLRGLGCWHCENRCVLRGFNDFKTTHPELEKFYSKDNTIPSSSRIFDPGASVQWICARCGGHAQATFAEAKKKHGIVYCYSCKKEASEEGHLFYKIEDTAIREAIGDFEFEKKNRYNDDLKKMIDKPSTDSKDFHLRDFVDRYKGDKKK